MVVGLKAEPGSAQEVVSIKGRVVNGTSGAEAPGALPVLLLATDQDGRVAATAQGLTDDTGGFEFGDLPLLDAGQYIFSVDYAGVRYGEVLSPEETSGGVEIQVFETTRDVTVVQVTRQVLVIAGVDRTEREISAIEFVLLANETDRTLLPDLTNLEQISFLRFALPPQPAELNVQSDLPGGDVVSIGTGFALTSPIIPGAHSIDFSYTFPYDAETLSYRQSLVQGASVFQVLVPENIPDLAA
ncbi:MAG: carboxypeptidase regulatory-like domain-containing protein, partial [Chloroflexi bacterium]|nr:carboxypeptidase regulatory-like domain-containing protein [Chloroflexota bacterium]